MVTGLRSGDFSRIVGELSDPTNPRNEHFFYRQLSAFTGCVSSSRQLPERSLRTRSPRAGGANYSPPSERKAHPYYWRSIWIVSH
jgi:hypothetical protein